MELIRACEVGDLEKVTVSLDDKTVNFRDTNGRTPLTIASIYDHTKITKMLLNYGADINSRDRYGSTALMYALGEDNIDVASILLDNKFIDTNILNDEHHSALIYASGYNLDIPSVDDIIKVIAVLLGRGADINIQDINLGTPLMFANNIKIMKFLLLNGADPDIRDIRNKTFLDSIEDESERKEMQDYINFLPGLSIKPAKF